MTAQHVETRPPAGRRRFTPLWALAAPLTWFAFVLAFDPTDSEPDPAGRCVWHMLFGIDGPTCGITRMTWYLLHGDLVNAARMHLAFLLGIPFLAYAWIWWIGVSVFGKRLPMPTSRKTVITILAAYAVFFVLYSTVLRNLPWAPFTWFYVPDIAQQ